jgi:hypothetical protein
MAEGHTMTAVEVVDKLMSITPRHDRRANGGRRDLLRATRIVVVGLGSRSWSWRCSVTRMRTRRRSTR